MQVPFNISYLEKHLDAKDESEHVVHSVPNLSLQRPGRNVGPLHGECDAVTGDEDQDQEVEPALGGQGPTLEAEPEESDGTITLWNIAMETLPYLCYGHKTTLSPRIYLS